jgi:hypothetical protein
MAAESQKAVPLRSTTTVAYPIAVADSSTTRKSSALAMSITAGRRDNGNAGGDAQGELHGWRHLRLLPAVPAKI